MNYINKFQRDIDWGIEPKQPMNTEKLYTESEVIKAIELDSRGAYQIDEIIDKLTPITLPTEEEIENSAKWVEGIEKLAWIEGAKWYEEFILNQIKK